LLGKVEIENFISERTHKPIALKFWVKMWYLSLVFALSSM